MSTLALLLTQTVNALSQSALLFFLGVGLTLIFGLMRIVNFAHGALYMLGAFVGYSIVKWTGNFWLALAGAPVAVALFGAQSAGELDRRLRFLGVSVTGCAILASLCRFQPCLQSFDVGLAGSRAVR